MRLVGAYFVSVSVRRQVDEAVSAYARNVTDSGAVGASQPRSGRLSIWVRRLAAIGTLPSDSDELRLRKAILTLSSTLMASLAFVWVVTYAVLGQWTSAAIPFVYQVASGVSIVAFSRTRRYRLFRRSQLCMSLLLPIGLQWSLGGFGNSSAVEPTRSHAV